MYFFLAYMMVSVGVLLSGLTIFLPPEMLLTMPKEFGYAFFAMGLLFAMMGLIMLHFRSIKVGANHLISPGRPDKILWFFIHKDDTLRIVPAIRDTEGLSYCKKLDSEAQELKSYRLFDHSIRIVVEGLGHCVDLKACLYAYFLKTKYGFKSLSEARGKKIVEQNPTKFKCKIVGRENQVDGNEINKSLSTQ